jgi:hypothetical protein
VAGGLTGGLVAVAVVVLVAMLARRGQSGDTSSDGSSSPEPGRDATPGGSEDDRDPDARDDEGDEGEDQDDPHVAAVTSQGEALVPIRHMVCLVPPEDEGEEWKVGAGLRAANRRGELALSMSWQAGEFTGVRVTQGGGEYEGPWRLEALGREGEYITFSFETRDGAEAAKQLFERVGIVQLGEDEDGRPMPPSAEQFAEARRIYLETEAALELPDDETPR